MKFWFPRVFVTDDVGEVMIIIDYEKVDSNGKMAPSLTISENLSLLSFAWIVSYP